QRAATRAARNPGRSGPPRLIRRATLDGAPRLVGERTRAGRLRTILSPGRLRVDALEPAAIRSRRLLRRHAALQKQGPDRPPTHALRSPAGTLRAARQRCNCDHFRIRRTDRTHRCRVSRQGWHRCGGRRPSAALATGRVRDRRISSANRPGDLRRGRPVAWRFHSDAGRSGHRDRARRSPSTRAPSRCAACPGALPPAPRAARVPLGRVGLPGLAGPPRRKGLTVPELRMPFLSLGDEEVVVIRWHKPVGTTVAPGEPLVEVETDKATMDVEAPFEGTLSAQFCEAGDTISPGSIIGYLTRPDEATDGGTTPESAIEQRSPTPSVLDVDLPASALAGPPPPLVEQGELRGLPAMELGEDATRGSSTIPSVPTGPDGHRDVPLTRRRRAIGRRLSEAAQIPQFAVTRTVSLGAAQAAVTSARSSGINATVTDALVHAVSAALGESPNINAW